MNPLSGLEKLINEHGSATIRGERIKLIQDKYDLLEQETQIVRNRVSELLTERDALLEDVAARDKKIIELENENKSLNLVNQRLLERIEVGSQTHTAPLEQSKLDILLLLKEKSSMATGELAEATGRNKEALRGDLGDLAEADLINFERVLGTDIHTLAKKGRKYLKECGLLE